MIRFLLLALLISLGLNIYFIVKKPMIVTPDYAVLGIIDGDTFVIEGKNKIRLRHVQAPELEFCGGQEAKKMLENLIKDKRIKIQNEIPDPWGRSMGIVFVDGKNVNQILIASGLVRYYHDVTPFEDEFKKAAAQAESQRLGIYAKCETVDPPDPKCFIKGNIRRDRDDSHIYFLPNCAQYKFAKVSQDLGEKWFCSEKEALTAGYQKAETCH